MGRSIDGGLWRQWQARLSRYSGSGLTVVEFCRREDVSPASFYQWRKKLQGGSAGVPGSPVPAGMSGGRTNAELQRLAGRFVPVVPVGGGSTGTGLCRANVVVVLLANGVRVEVPCSEPALVERVVRTAGHDAGTDAEERA